MASEELETCECCSKGMDECECVCPFCNERDKCDCVLFDAATGGG